VSPDGRAEDRLRRLAPQVLGALVRRYGHFDACEDAVQEALLAAARQWPESGEPTDPKAWLITVASRRLTDALRSDASRRRREETDAVRAGTDAALAPAADETGDGGDDTLTLFFLCCHPSLSPSSQLALTLRAVGGLTTAEIARAFLVPEATMGQRISRAKQSIESAGREFAMPPAAELGERLAVVLHVLYLMFNEGYTASSGSELLRTDLTAEAIRLTREIHRLLPEEGEVTGLLALMLLTDARREARTGPDGGLIPLTDQDRSRWDGALVAEGVALVSHALATAPLGPYQVQAAIAAVHDEATTADDTDWPQILALYRVLDRIAPNPMATLNQAVAVAMVDGPAAGLALLAELEDDPRVARHHRLLSVRAHLLELAGDEAGAREAFRAAAKRTTSAPERRFLEAKAARLGANANASGTAGGSGLRDCGA
jgi:RNA polymerase sigma factor (sigma-70 family)